ncbi:hypothetical protein [Herbidospora cretacea]|uniref:hypothetical protein n=1 Tax=Herbidospora cretacea TaxID=28444 RepID=UPI0012DF9A46|nr:hypothetical protein [Herbidospora cretacea]
MGPLIEGYQWRLAIEELLSPRYQEITEAANGYLLRTEQLVALFEDAQLIDGELTAHDADGRIVGLTICALDGTWWDVETAIQEILNRISDLYPDAEKLPWPSHDEG